MKKYKLDSKEQELLHSLENEGWVSVPDLEKEKLYLQKAAQTTLGKIKRINLRLTQRDFELAHIKALEEGMPYQTLLSSIIHKFLIGRLVEKYYPSDI